MTEKKVFNKIDLKNIKVSLEKSALVRYIYMYIYIIYNICR